MKKIGLVVVTYKDNFGSALQTYATQYVLNSLGYQTRIFDINGVHKDINRKKVLFYLSRCFEKDERKYLLDNLTSRFRKKTNASNDKYAENMRIRHQMYAEFNKKWLKFFSTVNSWDALSKQSEKCDHVIVGSDQLWRPSNIAGCYFTLEFVPDHVDKIVLSTSFGVSELPKSIRPHAKKFLNRINSISVREETGKKLVKKLTGRNIPVVCDPTMLLDAEQWKVIQKEKPFIEGEYILVYLMGDNPKHREFVKRLKELTGYKIVGLLHGGTYLPMDENFADIEPYDVGSSEFINLIRNAKYMCTDSFHGTVFSILNRTKFFSFRRFEDTSEFSTNDRLHTLLSWTGLSERMLYGSENVNDCVSMEIDYDAVHQRIAKKCSGCSACYNACKVGALSMADDNTGFWYPVINREKCIECGACAKVCPALHKQEYTSDEPKAYIVQNKDDKIRLRSTSGGAFTGIARQIIANGGVVFGAAINAEFQVSHIYVETEKELAKFRSSKYVQSRIGNAYVQAEKFLRAGREVCFSGTPCQINGLKNYLRQDYPNLVTVDVMCRAVPSPKVLQKYLDYQRTKYPDYDRIVFRDKGRGYSYSCVTLYQGRKVLYRGGSESDPWLRLFLGGYCNRESCHDCLYQSGVRASDITMWDCWGTQNYAPEWDDNKGTTNIIACTQKGEDLITNSDSGLRIKEIRFQLNGREHLSYANIDRKMFFDDLFELDATSFINKYVYVGCGIKFKRTVRYIMYRVGIYNSIRNVAHKVRKIKKERRI